MFVFIGVESFVTQSALCGIASQAFSTIGFLPYRAGGAGWFLLEGDSHRNSLPSCQIESQLLESRAQCAAKVNVELESKNQTMKAKHLLMGIAALLVPVGLWVGRTTGRTDVSDKSNLEVFVNKPEGEPKPGQMLRPPDPTRRFRDLTPEERVKLARRGPIGG